MTDEPREAEAENPAADWSFLPQELAPPRRELNTSRPLEGVRSSIWFPIIIGIVIWQWTGFVFGPLRPISGSDWTWIIGFYMTSYSVLPAQICLLNIGLLFGPGQFRQRAFAYWLIGGLLLLSWYLWLAWANWSQYGKRFRLVDEDFANMGIFLPLFVLTLQLPSMVLLFWRWRLVNMKTSAEKDPPRDSPQFSIAELMIATAVIAATLVWYRWLLQWTNWQTQPGWERSWIRLWWHTIVIGVAVVLPTWAWLAIRRWSYFVGWCLSLVYLVSVVASGCLFYYVWDELFLGGGDLQIIVGMTVGFGLPMIVGVHLLRGFGWRLERRGCS